MQELLVLDVESDADAEGLPALRYEFDVAAYEVLRKTLLGKRLLFTDHDDWTNEEIVLGYRSQHHVEGAFRPAHHWTDRRR